MLISFAAARLEVASCISSSSSGAFKDNSSLVLSQQKLTGFGILRQTKNMTDWGLASCARHTDLLISNLYKEYQMDSETFIQ